MKSLLLLLVAAIPYYTVGYFWDGSYINLTQILMLLVAGIGCIKTLSTGLAPSVFARPARLMLWGFLLSVMIGLVVSPYEGKVISKGMVQLGGILSAITLSAIVSSEIARSPDFILNMANVAAKSFGLFAVIAIIQFVVWNATGQVEMLSFDFLNKISGGNIWRGGGSIGPFIRANSWASEPAHFTRYLGFVLSFALVRLGLMGAVAKRRLIRIIPLWTALAVVIGFFVAFSILGLMQFALTVGLLLAFGRKIKPATIFAGAAVFVVMAAFMWVFSMAAGSEFQSKLTTLSLLWDSSSSNSAKHVDTADISALAVSSNWEVAMRNMEQDPLLGGGIGSHGLAYDQYAPSIVFLNPTLYRLNADDAAGLGARLFSETGLLGLLSFTGIFLCTAIASRAVALRSGHSWPPDTITLTRLCFVVSLISVFVMYLLRAGQYFDPLLYVLLGVVASVRRTSAKRAWQLRYA
ncbi:hypothetical protein GNZ12_03250 [Paraburkholderia sp. 1N]|uniref:O-antigen ligase n=1 Tax=Paraburkholderia solitsugae TaxID=2675748 RepID=A0ABX2BJL8_9BURK|nr:hypothetical protein [Paraburkholderia solitsugae]NPT40345.1 hypothetical protein [Paraburkholderia solitsugae]